MAQFSLALKRFIMGLKRPSKTKNLRLLQKRGDTIESFTIREVTSADIPSLAALHVKTWSETYWTVAFPPTLQIREYQWRQQFQVTDESWFCFVVENRNGELVGFAKGKTYSHNDLPGFSGELNKIYLLRTYQRIGLGRQLFLQVVRKFISKGISNMVLFGVAENPSCAFHEAMGGEKLFAKNGEFHGGYCWRDLRNLVVPT